MSTGLVNFNWDFISKYSNEEISYFLYLEGKSIETISIIRNLPKQEIQKHLISCKIKYRHLVKSDNIYELFKKLQNTPKNERIYVLNELDVVNKTKLIDYIINNHLDITLKEKEFGIWVLGELKAEKAVDFLIKCTVHKFVNIRRMSVSALGKIGNGSCERALLRALKDENHQVVSYAIKSLEKIKSENCKETIKEIYNSTDKDYLKKSCEDFFKNCEKVDE